MWEEYSDTAVATSAVDDLVKIVLIVIQPILGMVDDIPGSNQLVLRIQAAVVPIGHPVVDRGGATERGNCSGTVKSIEE